MDPEFLAAVNALTRGVEGAGPVVKDAENDSDSDSSVDSLFKGTVLYPSSASSPPDSPSYEVRKIQQEADELKEDLNKLVHMLRATEADRKHACEHNVVLQEVHHDMFISLQTKYISEINTLKQENTRLSRMVEMQDRRLKRKFRK